MSESILDTILENKERSEALTTEPHTLVIDLINHLRDNEQDVLIRRFGLSGGAKGETLEQVGRSRGVTRERIRQIEKNSIKKLKQLYQEKKELKALEKMVIRILEEYGNLMEENHLLDTLLQNSALSNSKEDNKQAVLFVLDNLFSEPNLLKNDPDFHNSWYLSKASLDEIKKIIAKLEAKIAEKDELVDEDGVRNIFNEIEVEQKPFEAYLIATKKIEQNNFGQWGLSSWTTVTPKRVSDKAYLVLKKEGKPLHFKKITELINKAAFSDKKAANVGTVHNELIMDKRYVLIGRGIYALTEWGYVPGTVKEIITKFLREQGPMDRSEIIEKVSKQRLVNENTIKVVLMDKNTFKKVGRNQYGLVGI
jgi:DNA-directed RNA polymerase delta subunit